MKQLSEDYIQHLLIVSNYNDIFTAIITTVREYFIDKNYPNVKAHKDCVITVNNADMNTINALTGLTTTQHYCSKCNRQ